MTSWLNISSMALVRCEEHYPDPERTKRNYVVAVEPVGFPDTAAICGRKNREHDNPGVVVLHESEYELYKQGQRVFDPNTASVDIRVTDKIVDEF